MIVTYYKGLSHHSPGALKKPWETSVRMSVCRSRFKPGTSCIWNRKASQSQCSVRSAACSDLDNWTFFLAMLEICYRDFGNKTGDDFVWEQVFSSRQSAGFVSLLLTVVLVVLSPPDTGIGSVRWCSCAYAQLLGMERHGSWARPPTHSLGRLVQSSDEIYVGLVSGLVRFRTR